MFIQNLIPGIPKTSASIVSMTQERSGLESVQVEESTVVGGESQSISYLAQLAYSYKLSELEVNENKTSYAYYKDDMSMAMRASSTYNAKVREEKISLDLTFSAEVMGLTAEDFEANGGKPIVYNFSIQTSKTLMTYTSEAKLNKTIRPPEDVLRDMVKGLTDVMREPGNKSIRYDLDEEALQALGGEDYRLILELILMMQVINEAMNPGPKNKYTIFVSGKGKPFLEYNETTTLETNKVAIDFSITIQPPASAQVGSGDTVDLSV